MYLICDNTKEYDPTVDCCLSLEYDIYVTVFYLYFYALGWHTLPLHANAEACLTGWPNA